MNRVPRVRGRPRENCDRRRPDEGNGASYELNVPLVGGSRVAELEPHPFCRGRAVLAEINPNDAGRHRRGKRPRVLRPIA